MLPAVRLDDQLCGPRYEVADEGGDWDLTIETNPGDLSGAEMGPQEAFGIRRIGAQFARAECRSAVGFVQQALPQPLPQAGGEISARLLA